MDTSAMNVCCKYQHEVMQALMLTLYF